MRGRIGWNRGCAIFRFKSWIVRFPEEICGWNQALWRVGKDLEIYQGSSHTRWTSSAGSWYDLKFLKSLILIIDVTWKIIAFSFWLINNLLQFIFFKSSTFENDEWSQNPIKACFDFIKDFFMSNFSFQTFDMTLKFKRGKNEWLISLKWYDLTFHKL